MAARTVSGLLGFRIIGKKAMVLISRAIQVYRGILEDTATREEVNRVQEKIQCINNIKLGGGVEPPN